jgi:hypothetical protein
LSTAHNPANTHRALHTGQVLHVLDVELFRIADQIDLGQCLLTAALDMHAGLNTGQSREVRHQLLVFWRLLADVGI